MTAELTWPRVQNVLISRFLLNLKRTQAPSVASRPSGLSLSGFQVPTIASIVEDMGRPLQHGWDEREEDAQDDIHIEIPITECNKTSDDAVSASSNLSADRQNVENYPVRAPSNIDRDLLARHR